MRMRYFIYGCIFSIGVLLSGSSDQSVAVTMQEKTVDDIGDWLIEAGFTEQIVGGKTT